MIGEKDQSPSSESPISTSSFFDPVILLRKSPLPTKRLSGIRKQLPSCINERVKKERCALVILTNKKYWWLAFDECKYK